MEHINYPNWLEYSELFDEYGPEELGLAYRALTDHELQNELYENESPLLVFLIDTDMQEKLILYFEDSKDYRKEYDW